MRNKLGIIVMMVLMTTAALLAAPASVATIPDERGSTNGTEHPTDASDQAVRDKWARQDARDAARNREVLRAGTCNLFATTDTGHEDPGGLDKWVDVRVRVLAKQCMGVHGHRWVRPVSATYSYNVEHAHQSCGYWDEFEGVRYDLYLSDGAGRNFHPAQVRLYCEEDTTSEYIQSLHNAPNFRYCWGVPKWKSNYTVIIDSWNDVSGVLRDQLWDPNLYGPFRNEC